MQTEEVHFRVTLAFLRRKMGEYEALKAEIETLRAMTEVDAGVACVRGEA